MPLLAPWRKTQLQIRRDKLEKQIAALDVAIDQGVDRGHISNYEFDSGEGKHKTTYRNLNEVIKARDLMEAQLQRIYSQLSCRAVVNLNLRRYRHLNHGFYY